MVDTRPPPTPIPASLELTAEPDGVPKDDGDKSRKYRMTRNGTIALLAGAALAFTASITLHAWLDVKMFVSFYQWGLFSASTLGIATGVYGPVNVWEKYVLTNGKKKA